jgi:hypothetical protein
MRLDTMPPPPTSGEQLLDLHAWAYDAAPDVYDQLAESLASEAGGFLANLGAQRTVAHVVNAWATSHALLPLYRAWGPPSISPAGLRRALGSPAWAAGNPDELAPGHELVGLAEHAQQMWNAAGRLAPPMPQALSPSLAPLVKTRPPVDSRSPGHGDATLALYLARAAQAEAPKLARLQTRWGNAVREADQTGLRLATEQYQTAARSLGALSQTGALHPPGPIVQTRPVRLRT